MEKSFCIDGLQVSDKARKLLTEIDEMRDFSGKNFPRVALFPEQFLKFKRSRLAAMERSTHSTLKEAAEGKRLKPGQLKRELENQGYQELEGAETLLYRGVALYDKAAVAQVA
jgi:hypothetical protein